VEFSIHITFFSPELARKCTDLVKAATGDFVFREMGNRMRKGIDHLLYVLKKKMCN
jgi:hypothetical protein